MNESVIIQKLIQVGQMLQLDELEYSGAEADIKYYLEQYAALRQPPVLEQKCVVKRSDKLWKKLIKELSVLQDDNFTARRLFDYVERHYCQPSTPKDSWSREEVIELIQKYSKECTGWPWFETDEKWIEENL